MHSTDTLAPFLGVWLGTEKGSGLRLMRVVLGGLVALVSTLILIALKSKTFDAQLSDTDE